MVDLTEEIKRLTEENIASGRIPSPPPDPAVVKFEAFKAKLAADAKRRALARAGVPVHKADSD